MTEKRFNCHVKFSKMPNGIMVLDYEKHGDEQTVIEDINREKAHRVMDRLNELNDENEQLKQQKPFLKIHNDYFIQYGDDRELFSLHKPSDIRSLIYLINRENGYDELECEYNEEGYGND